MQVDDIKGNWPPAIRDLDDAASYARGNVWNMLYWGLIPEYYYSSSDSSGVRVHPKDQVIRTWIAGAFDALYKSLYGGGYSWYHTKPAYYEGTTTGWGI